MARPLTRTQTLENRAFLDALTETGNIREAIRRTGLKHATMFHRRANHPAFATEWDAAVVVADARFHAAGGRRGPEAPAAGAKAGPAPLRTTGGEPVVVRRRDGTLQLRRAQPGKLTRACEQAFLSALSACANVTLAAAAAGAAEAAFYRRRRQNAGFAREMRLALAMGHERLEEALIHGFTAASHRDDAWRHNDPPPIPPMSAEQAIQLLNFHEKTVRLGLPREPDRLRAGETIDQWSARMAAIAHARNRRAFEDGEVARAAGREPEPPSRFEGDMAVYHVAEKLRLAAEAAARQDPVRPSAKRVRAAERAAGLREPGRAPEIVREGEATDPLRDPAAPKRVRLRKTGQAMFGGWRFEREE